MTVTVHTVAEGSAEVGASVNELLGEALWVNVCGEPVGHSKVNALAVAVTVSLKLMTTFELTGTLLAPFPGVALVTVGAVSGGGAVPFAMSEKSSTARPSSEPAGSKSVQRMKKLAPFAMLRPVMVLLIAVRLAA